MAADDSDRARLEALVAERTRELSRALGELERLNRVMRTMNATLDLDEVLDRLIAELGAAFSFEGIAILLVDESRSRLKTLKLRIPGMAPWRIEQVMRENEAIPIDLELGGGVARSVIKGRAYYFDDIDPDALPDGPNRSAVVRTGLRSIFIVPLLVEGEAIGVVLLSGYDRPLGFSEADLASIRRFVDQIAGAVKNSQMHESLLETTARLDQKTRELEAANEKLAEQTRLLEQLSRTDELTGIGNRRWFFERAEEELHRCRRFGTRLFVFMVDLDDFKQVNDTHGHSCGDSVLRQLARVLERATRKSDLLARYGGEEFVLASFDNDPAGAAALGERIRCAVAEHPFAFDGLVIRLTVSVGYACFPSRGGAQAAVDDIVREADEALYRAKACGKNCVVAQG